MAVGGEAVAFRQVAVETVALGGDPHRPGLVLKDLPRVVAAQAPGIFGVVTVMAEPTVRRVVAQDAGTGRDPHPSLPVVDHREGEAQVFAVLRGFVEEALEGLARGIEAVEPAALGADPQGAGGVFEDRPGVVVAEARWVLRVVTETLEALPAVLARQAAIEAAVVGADPQSVVPGFVDRPDPIVRQAALVFRVVADPPHPSEGRVEPVDAAVDGRKPQGAVFRLVDP